MTFLPFYVRTLTLGYYRTNPETFNVAEAPTNSWTTTALDVRTKSAKNMANNKYITIIIIFIRGFGLLNLLSSASAPRDRIFLLVNIGIFISESTICPDR